MSAAFLEAAGWGDAQATPLAADASSRHYQRLTKPGRSTILMQAPVTTEADRASLAAFRRIGAHLRAGGLSAPEEYAAAPEQGLLLIEDFGDTSLSRLLADPTQHDLAQKVYGTTAEVLRRLTRLPPLDLATPGPAGLAQMAALPLELIAGSDGLRLRLLPALEAALQAHASGPATLSLRDVHGDNLMWLPKRAGIARIGLLDFQDALNLPMGYDLASLVDDPRREVPEAWRNAMIRDFGDTARIDILSLARNVRILGIFQRLATRHGKPDYARFLPRTRTLVQRAAAGFPTLVSPIAELLERSADWVPEAAL